MRVFGLAGFCGEGYALGFSISSKGQRVLQLMFRRCPQRVRPASGLWMAGGAWYKVRGWHVNENEKDEAHLLAEQRLSWKGGNITSNERVMMMAVGFPASL